MLIKDLVKGDGGVTWEGDRGRGGGGGGVAEERDEEQKRGGSLTQALFACAVSSLVCRSGSLRNEHAGSTVAVSHLCTNSVCVHVNIHLKCGGLLRRVKY